LTIAEGSTKETLDADWPAHGKVSFKDVDLRYRPDCDLVLQKLSFDCEPGHKVGVVGRTGAGKSTMCLVLSRIIELESGTIHIDGKEASKIELETLREKITVIPQDPVIFDGTLKANLDPTGLIPDEDLKNILVEAGL